MKLLAIFQTIQSFCSVRHDFFPSGENYFSCHCSTSVIEHGMGGPCSNCFVSESEFNFSKMKKWTEKKIFFKFNKDKKYCVTTTRRLIETKQIQCTNSRGVETNINIATGPTNERDCDVELRMNKNTQRNHNRKKCHAKRPFQISSSHTF